VIALSVVTAAGLLWTFSRASLIALAAGFVVLAVVRRRPLGLVAAVLTLAVAVGWTHVFPKIGPTGNWTKADLCYQHDRKPCSAKGTSAPPPPTGEFTATSANEPSLHSHWISLRAGVRTVLHHPQGFGLGNAGQIASRTGGKTPVKAGESNYTELGVELGLVGALVWAVWGLVVFVGLAYTGREEHWAAGLAAAFAAILVLAIQTDVLGDPWVAYCVWGLAGALVLRTQPRERLVAEGRRPLAH
jgi:hypothetical protein